MQTTSPTTHSHPVSVVKQVFDLAGWLLLTFLAGFVGAVASIHAAEFYGQLSRPAWAPPASVFGPVWTLLYALMGIAAWLVWRERGEHRVRGVLGVYVAQLLANALWSWLFFAWHRGAWAFGEILVLWVLIAATVIGFWRVRRLAAVLLLPYLAWVTFAIALCHATWRMNPQALG